MIHDTKLFVRRLAYMPWLLAVGLVLGWTGEAAAQDADVIDRGCDRILQRVSNVTFTVVLSPPLTGTGRNERPQPRQWTTWLWLMLRLTTQQA